MQGWERANTLTPYQRPQTRDNRRHKSREQLRPIKMYWSYSRNPLVPHRRIQGQQDRSTVTGIKVMRYSEVQQRGGV